MRGAQAPRLCLANPERERRGGRALWVELHPVAHAPGSPEKTRGLTMSSPQNTPPTDPRATARKQFTSAVIWTVLAVVIAVVLFMQAAKPDNDKKNFYILAGVIAVIAALVN